MPLDRDETKEAMKEALKEWLNERAAQFGWWSLYGIGALALAALAYFILHQSGWQFVKGAQPQ